MGVVDRRRVPKTSPIHDAIPTTRFAAEDDGGRGIGAVLAGHDEDVACARVLCLG